MCSNDSRRIKESKFTKMVTMTYTKKNNEGKQIIEITKHKIERT